MQTVIAASKLDINSLARVAIGGMNINNMRIILEFMSNLDAAFMSASQDDLTHDWTRW